MKRNKSFDNKAPLLYLLATPIGNLKDITYRAIETLNDADLIACEDTRNTKKLLSFYNINKPTFSLHEHNEKSASAIIIERVLNGEKVVYVSDAGYPLVSDPGFILVEECLKNDINVSLIPGPCAFLSALLPSGLDTSHFYFHGFLNPKDSLQKKELETLKGKPETIIFYEAPHRILKTLKNIAKVLTNRKIVLARELTKLHEEYIYFKSEEVDLLDEDTLKGEMVIVVEGNNEEIIVSDEDIINTFHEMKKSSSLSTKDIIKELSNKFNVNKNKIYNIVNKIN